MKTPRERFWEWVEIGECWHWKGIPGDHGYGTMYVDGKTRLAHRLSHEWFIGPIPEGFQVDHRCHNEDANCPGGKSCAHRRCVNPAHLEAVTPRENTLRGMSPSAECARVTECKHGHSFTDENTYRRPDGKGRGCRQCIRRRNAARFQGAVS